MDTKKTWALALASVVMVGCMHAATVRPDGPGPDGPPPPAERAEAEGMYEAATAVFARHEAAGRWDGDACREALGAFEAVNARMRGGSSHAFYMSGLTAARCGNVDGARGFYEHAVRVEPTLCEAHVALGLMELDAGHAPAARERFERAVEGDARCAPGYVNLAILQSREPAERDAAITNLRRALSVRADYLPALDRMALIYLDASDEHPELLDLAEVVCRQTQLIAPDHAPLYNTWALIDVARGDITGAVAKLSRAIDLDPRFYEALMNFGQLTLSQRAYADAQGAFAAARGVRPASYDAALGEGVALRGLTRPEDAEALYRAALELDGDRPEAWFDLAVLYHEHRDGTVEQLLTAERFLSEFVSRARGEARFSDTIAETLRFCGDPSARRRRAATCQRGRAQVIHDTLVLLGHRAESERSPLAR